LLSFQDVQDAGRTLLAKPIESNLRVAFRRPNTITLLFDKHNIMLFYQTLAPSFIWR
jgi:hypothetical protein